MITHLTAIKNNSKIVSLDTSRMERALNYSKKDIDLFFYKLAVIADKHFKSGVQNQAWKYLNKQDKLQNILSHLLNRLDLLKTIPNNYSRKEISRKLIQLNREIEIFNEIHFRVKRTYLRFTTEHFQEGLERANMVA